MVYQEEVDVDRTSQDYSLIAETTSQLITGCVWYSYLYLLYQVVASEFPETQTKFY